MFSAPLPVIPDDKARDYARILNYTIFVQSVLLLCVLFTGQLWSLFQLLSIAAAYFAVSDNLRYKPGLLVIYFTATIFGVVFIAVDALIEFSFLITGTKNPEGVPPSEVSPYPGVQSDNKYIILGFGLFYTLLSLVMSYAAYISWQLYKRLMSPACRTPSVDRIHAPFVTGGEYSVPIGNYNAVGSTSNGGFVPFQGTGSRLGTH